jgi:hypothetical protein
MNRMLTNLSFAAIAGSIFMVLSSSFPTDTLRFPGSFASSYGVPLTYLIRYHLDLIGYGVTFNLLYLLVDYFLCVGFALFAASAANEAYSRLASRAKAMPTIIPA